MIKWFEGNPVALALAVLGGGLLLISIILGVIWSLPPSASGTDQGGNTAELALNVPQLGENKPLDSYVVITDRPVFNESRQPVIEDESADEDEEPAEEVDAPDLELAGVVITPSLRMVTLKSKDGNKSLVAFEGRPLEGNYGTWQVSSIEPRQITLSSDSGEQKQLKLQVHDQTIAEPPKLAVAENEEPGKPGGQESRGENDAPLSRAEEIRQRIAERREELRRAAEDQEDGQLEEGQQAPKDYKSAIQSMINGTSQQKDTDENER